MMGDYTPKYFKPAEWQCRCGCGLDAIDMNLIRALDFIRERFGRPIIITSGCRCENHNKAVRGQPRSAHLIGPDGLCHAVDIACCAPSTRSKLLFLARGFGITRFGIGSTFLHFDNAPYLPQNVIWLYDWNWLNLK